VSQDSDGIKTTALRTPGMPVGMLPDVPSQWHRCHIPPNSRLYIFSDGIYEIMQADQTIMGLDDFVDILASLQPGQTIDDILTEVTRRNQNQPFADDLSLLEVVLS
jgi:sigma-B regulation protein RsbU (phosphoserine phosphatase)